MHAHATPGGAVAERHPMGAPSSFPARRLPTSGKLAVVVTALLGLFSLYACSGDGLLVVSVPDGTTPSLADAQLQVVDGDGQQGRVATVLQKPLVVSVTSSSGAPIEGAPVQWVFLQGRGRKSGSGSTHDTIQATTDALGQASVSWELGTVAGVQQTYVELAASDAPPAASDGPLAAPGQGRRWWRFTARATGSSVSTVTVSPRDTSAAVGNSVQLQATVKDRYGNVLDSSVVWSSSQTSVAHTTQMGLVQAMSPGTSTISATSGFASGSADWTSTTAIARVVASPDTVVLANAGDTGTISATAFDASGATIADPSLEYKSLNTTVAEVDSVGRLTAKGTGVALIAVTAMCCGNAGDSVVVQVNGSPDTLTIVVVDQSAIVVEDLSLQAGDSAWLDATAINALGLSLGEITATWSSSDPAVASVSSAGVVHAVAPGSTNIVASYDGATATVPTIVTDSVTVSPPPTNRVVLFHSDWSTATGTGDAALRDTNKAKPWTGTAGLGGAGQGGNEVRSTAADGRDYPTTNYLRTTGKRSNQGWNELFFQASDGYVPKPAVGESVYVRMYFRLIVANSFTGDGETHGAYFDDAPGGTNWGPQALGVYVQHFTAGVWNFLISTDAGQFPRYYGPGNHALNRNQTYRIEMAYHRTGTNTYQLEGRIYDVAGHLLYDNSSFNTDYYGPTGTNLQNRTFTTSGAGAASISGFKIGLNGLTGMTADVPYAEYAAVAICKNDWCGPYAEGQ